MKLTIEVLSQTPGIFVHIDSENLDAGNAKEFKEQILPHINSNELVILDMGSLKFVDSSGLGALLSCLHAMNKKHGQLKLVNMNKSVIALFELVRMHRIFSIYNTREEAIGSL